MRVDLPRLGLTGEWTVTEPERTLAAYLAPMLPVTPPSDADVRTRWDVAHETLRMVLTVVRDNAELLFGERTSVVSEPDTVTMVEMPFAIARVLGEARTTRALHEGAGGADEWTLRWLDGIEPELDRLRRLLSEAAERAG